jgi:glycogen operon protein
MTDEAWNTSFARSVMVFLNGDRILEPGPRGERIVDDSLLILLNADTSPLGFVLPPSDYGEAWSVVLDTNQRLKTATAVLAGGGIRLEAHSVVVLSRPSLGP